jgi:hypothetical protein
MVSLANDRRGSAAVLIVVLFAGLIGLTSVILAASKSAAGRSCADAAFRLAGRSILSEYDLQLYKDYGILAFKGDENQIEKDLSFYADATLSSKTTSYGKFLPLNPGSKMITANTEYTASIKQFSLLDTEIFESQIKQAVPRIMAESIAGLSASDSGTGFGDIKGEPESARVLRNKSIRDALPSAEYGSSGFLGISAASLSSLGGFLGSSGSKITVDEYILNIFGHANDGVYSDERFFANEAEYIISGKDSDSSNYSAVKVTLIALRTLMNNISLLADNEKRTIIQELSAPFAAAGGIGEAIAFVAITELWVAAETRNDIMLLEDGGKVALYKTKQQWATDNIEAIVDGFVSDKPEYPADKSGLSYRDYLRGLLYLTDHKAKLLRVMDLIQINLKTKYDRDFLLREYYTGFRFMGKAWGDEISYTERY